MHGRRVAYPKPQYEGPILLRPERFAWRAVAGEPGVAQRFLDGTEHRRALHTIYNHYARCSADPGYRAEREAEQALLRPLFTTSFLLDDFLREQQWFGATQVLLSSASSKTAFATAFCLAQRRGAPGAPRVVGLTSPGKLGFTQSLGCYDDVLGYDDVPRLDPQVPSVYVDFAGHAGAAPGDAAALQRLSADVDALRTLRTKRERNPPRKHGNIPL